MALVPHEDFAVVHSTCSRRFVSQRSDRRRDAGGLLSLERHARVFEPLQLCGVRVQSPATPTFPEIEVFVLACVSVSRREPRAFEGPAGHGDLGRRSLLRSCRRPGAAVVSAEAPHPRRLRHGVGTGGVRRWTAEGFGCGGAHRRRSARGGRVPRRTLRRGADASVVRSR